MGDERARGRQTQTVIWEANNGVLCLGQGDDTERMQEIFFLKFPFWVDQSSASRPFACHSQLGRRRLHHSCVKPIVCHPVGVQSAPSGAWIGRIGELGCVGPPRFFGL